MREPPRLSEREEVVDYNSLIFMIVGPHSGFSLDQIITMKQDEERHLGFFYWGYAGSLCHPLKVQEFARTAQHRNADPPKVVMVETKARYTSRTVGRLGRYSLNGGDFHPLEEGVTLIGCTIAVTCRNLKRSAALIDMNRYRVANGRRAGMPMGEYIRHQVNKACAFLAPAIGAVPSRTVRLVAVADLVEPYCVYLAE